MSTVQTSHETPVGTLLRAWRQARKMTQMDLALEAQVSTRHVSFLETGRSLPSREMLLILSSVMELPLRERNALLVAAGAEPVRVVVESPAPDRGER